MSKTIFIVDDEPDILNLLGFILSEEGYTVHEFTSGEEALKKIELIKPDLITLDLMLPGMSGLEICKIIKSNLNTWNIPIIVLSSRSEEFDILTGLTVGCDDYITKPFSEKILLAKIKSIFLKEERKTAESNLILKIKDMLIDPDRFEISIKGKLLNFTATEFKILHFLAKNTGRVYTRDQIFESFKETDFYSGDRSIDILIGRIRKKLGNYGRLIESIYGVGYRLKEYYE
ncbi:MAG: response regulator transcription factor [Candidatus Gastranaerophilales bacterium]|nr:response regulator transcription factor [Candidatus Gastranaerophilales bacterium]